MLTGHLALVAAAIFSGAAVYINVAEQPARLALDDGSLLAEWKLAYERGLKMQPSLVVIGSVLGALAWWQAREILLALGALVLFCNVPWTLVGMMPTNKALKITDAAGAGSGTRALIERWGSLHAVRTVLGFSATTLFLLALL